VLSLLHAVDRPLAVAMAALFAVLIASTVVLRLTYQLTTTGHLSVLDAAYFTVETITTVGYGDFSFRGQAPWLMASAICLMLAGALFVAVFFALLTNALVSRRISESLGRQRITGLTGHILVIGLGSVGVQVVHQLAAAGRDIVVLEKNEHNRHLGRSALSACRGHRRCHYACGPGVGPAHQRLRRAVVTSDDLANLETGLAVRDQLGARWETTPVVLRIFDPQLARSDPVKAARPRGSAGSGPCLVGELTDLNWRWPATAAQAGRGRPRQHHQAGAGDGFGGGTGGADAQDGIPVAVQDEDGTCSSRSFWPCHGAPTCLLWALVSRGPLSASRSIHSRAASSSNG